MKKIIYILSLAVLASCSNNKKQKNETDYSATPTGLSGLQNTGAGTATSTNAGTTATEGNLLLNPEHGKPGHRCDLAVGAPLNSAPTQATTPPPTPQPAPNQTVSAPVPTTTTPTVNEKGQKLNPAHGQPGHKCEIAVGAPLDSKPVQTNISKTSSPTVTTSTTTPSTAPVASVNANGQKLNPAHGQPGHKCEIAVGAPLT